MTPKVTPDLEELLANLPGTPLLGLRQADLRLQAWRNPKTVVHQMVQTQASPLSTPAGGERWDVVICGGTLGILMAAALAKLGWQVLLIERGELRGRTQEWNISRQELTVLVTLELLTPNELEQVIVSEFNPVRVSFAGSSDLWVKDVLNTGVDPVYLLERLKQRFLGWGGTLKEHHQFQQASVHPDGVAVTTLDATGSPCVYTGRLLLDAMGHGSPLVAQARAQGDTAALPESICLVVGTCAQGFRVNHPANHNADLMASFTPCQAQGQYFWEAFPARDGRTTYLFTYTHPQSPQPLTLEQLFADYLRLLPDYQQVSLDQLQIQRALFGAFPSYRQSPLQPTWDRVLAIGDSSGQQSPLSFGGFGAMLRHLLRLQTGIDAALRQDCLSQPQLALLQPYQPNLSVTWLFQQAMTLSPQQIRNHSLPPEQINQILGTMFTTMAELGDPVLRPFLQDNLQFAALTQALVRAGFQHPGLVAKIIAQVGPLALLAWLPHYLNLGLYSGLNHLSQPLTQTLPTLAKTYTWQQRLAAWRYGSGADYGYH
jgi:lycopene cyclase CruP